MCYFLFILFFLIYLSIMNCINIDHNHNYYATSMYYFMQSLTLIFTVYITILMSKSIFQEFRKQYEIPILRGQDSMSSQKDREVAKERLEQLIGIVNRYVNLPLYCLKSLFEVVNCKLLVIGVLSEEPQLFFRNIFLSKLSQWCLLKCPHFKKCYINIFLLQILHERLSQVIYCYCYHF